MYQAIEVKYLPCTTHKPLRYKAFCAAGNVVMSTEFADNATRNAINAARKLIEKMGWKGVWHGGVLKNGNHVFVLAGSIHDEFNIDLT